MKQYIHETKKALELYKLQCLPMTYVLPLYTNELCNMCRLAVPKRIDIIHELKENGNTEYYCSEECWLVRDYVERRKWSGKL